MHTGDRCPDYTNVQFSAQSSSVREDTCIQSLQGQFKPSLEATPPLRQVASSEAGDLLNLLSCDEQVLHDDYLAAFHKTSESWHSRSR